MCFAQDQDVETGDTGSPHTPRVKDSGLSFEGLDVASGLLEENMEEKETGMTRGKHEVDKARSLFMAFPDH